MSKIITADFSSGKDRVTARGLWQFDRGVKLKVIGINVADVNRVDFASVIASDSVPVVVVPDGDGTFTVSIPGAVTKSSYGVTAYIYVDTADYGYTVKAVNMPVTLRQEAWKPGEEEKPDPFGEVVEKVSGYAKNARYFANAAAESEKAASESATTATQQATTAAQSATNASGSAESASQSAEAATTAAGNAAESATSASQSAETAGQKATAAETSASNAAESATAAEKSATAAGDSASAAKTSETAATASAVTATEQAEKIKASAEQIEKNKTDVASLKGDLETKADNAEFNATLEELTAEVMCSRNVFDDSEYVGDTMPDYTQVNQKNFYGDFKYLKLGTPYFVQVEYTDGTKGNEQLIWQYVYADGTFSSAKSLGVSNIAEKDVKFFSINRTTGYTNTDDGKQIAHVWMTSGSNVYEPYKVSVKSERLENIENDVSNAMLSTDYMNQKNLLTDDNITDNLQIQPYTTVTDENYCSAYIPIKTGETLYVNYSLGTPTAYLCKADKTKISWVTMPYSNDDSARNVGYKVDTENVEYIRLSWDKTRSTIKGDLFFSTEPIRFKTPDEQFDKSYIPEVSTGRLDNWWYLKTGDSLGDSLTGQGFFQSWTKKYFGLKRFDNHGVGGSKLSGDDVDSSRLSMWKDERINALNANADFITVLGGQNDGNVTIGEITKTNYDTNTYVGALNTIIDKIYDHCKQGVIIILCTPFYVPAEGDDGERFDVLGNAVREVGKLRGLPVADFGGLCTADKKTADLYWSSSDRTHPNENFYRDKIAPILISTMESIKPINWENVNYYD